MSHPEAGATLPGQPVDRRRLYGLGRGGIEEAAISGPAPAPTFAVRDFVGAP